MANSPTIFYHVGTGKTGTTYLQYRVFPKMQGITYLQRTRYVKYPKLIAQSKEKRFLLSREFDQQLEREIKAFAQYYPDTHPIIVFRRHDSYIASQYRRFVKNGFKGRFTDFFDIQNDQGFFKKVDLNYRHQVDLLKRYFTQPPLVLLYEDMRADPKSFFQAIANHIGATLNVEAIDLSRVHTSYSVKQLHFIHRLSQRMDLRKRRIFRNGILHFFWRLYLGSIRYSVLFLGKYLPVRHGDQPLISPECLETVKNAYAEDWAYVQKIAVRTGNE